MLRSDSQVGDMRVSILKIRKKEGREREIKANKNLLRFLQNVISILSRILFVPFTDI